MILLIWRVCGWRRKNIAPEHVGAIVRQHLYENRRPATIGQTDKEAASCAAHTMREFQKDGIRAQRFNRQEKPTSTSPESV